MKKLFASLVLVLVFSSLAFAYPEAVNTKEKRVDVLAEGVFAAVDEFVTIPEDFALEKLGSGYSTHYIFESEKNKLYVGVNVEIPFEAKELTNVNGFVVGFDRDGSFVSEMGSSKTKVGGYYMASFKCDSLVPNEEIRVYFEAGKDRLTDFDGVLNGLTQACIKLRDEVQRTEAPTSSPSPIEEKPSPQPSKQASPTPVDQSGTIYEPSVTPPEQTEKTSLLGMGIVIIAVMFVAAWLLLKQSGKLPPEAKRKGSRK